jgi:hypothetical protein
MQWIGRDWQHQHLGLYDLLLVLQDHKTNQVSCITGETEHYKKSLATEHEFNTNTYTFI